MAANQENNAIWKVFGELVIVTLLLVGAPFVLPRLGVVTRFADNAPCVLFVTWVSVATKIALSDQIGPFKASDPWTNSLALVRQRHCHDAMS
jgi:hypothetical protein